MWWGVIAAQGRHVRITKRNGARAGGKAINTSRRHRDSSSGKYLFVVPEAKAEHLHLFCRQRQITPFGALHASETFAKANAFGYIAKPQPSTHQLCDLVKTADTS